MNVQGSRRQWARVLLGPIALAAALVAAAPAAAQTPDPNSAVEVLPRPCALDVDDKYEQEMYELEGWKAPNYERYPGACQRMKFTYGPIAVKPGQNDVLLGPVTIEKPNQDGYITRFKPNLVRTDGTVPPVEQVHLHHGTWLSLTGDYGSGPFFAAGEEKTIAPWPRGFGMPIKATDQWQLLHMVHSAVSEPMETYITYEIDFVPAPKAEEVGLKPAYPVWLDVRPSGYPVFNVQRKYGGDDQECTWPKEECAAFDPFGKPAVGQGQPGNGVGEDLELPERGERFGKIASFNGGTLIGIGGHLHPGGIQNEIDLVRPGGETVQVRKPYTKRVRRMRCVRRRAGRCVKRKRVTRMKRCTRRRGGVCVKRKVIRGKCTKRKVVRTKQGKRRRCVRRAALRRKVTRHRTVTERQTVTRIYNGRAQYWDRQDPSKPGGPPTSWDFSMEVQGAPRWGIRVRPGDRLRSNATYDTKYGASYENMGIAIALFAPDTEDGKPTAPGVNPFHAPRDNSKDCRSGGAANGKLCEFGLVTHGHYKENSNYGGPSGTWNAPRGMETNEVAIANFLYAPGDLSQRSMGIPTVKLGSKLRFTNTEGAGIYHTVTTCKFPCLGQTGAAFPLPDGETSAGRMLDLDSSELGFGAPGISAPKQRPDWEVPVTEQEGFKDGETVTYFCRVHPFMRGAFEVKK